MKTEMQRIELLTKQTAILFKQFQDCINIMSLFYVTHDERLFDNKNLKGETLGEPEKPGVALNKLRTVCNDIKTLLTPHKENLEKNGEPNLSNVKALHEKIKELENLNYNFGYTYSTRVEPHFDRDVKSRYKSTLEYLNDTIIYCLRTVFRIADNVINGLRGSKNYNDQGETPSALNLTGRTQFFPQPVSSAYNALLELQKANGVLKEAINRFEIDNVDTPKA